MINFAPITYIDVLPIIGGLWKRRNDFIDAELGSPVRVMEIRTLGDDSTDIRVLPVVRDWVNLSTLLNKTKTLVSAEPMGVAFIEEIPPRSVKPWAQEVGEYFELYRRFQLPLAINPGCIMYAGNEFLHPQVGHLIETNPRMWNSAVNFGDHPRYHLVMDIRRSIA